MLIDDTHAATFDQSTAPTSNESWPWIRGESWSEPPADQCTAPDAIRRDCGFNGITPEQCRAKGCCSAPLFDDSAQWGPPTCFYSTQATQDLYFFGHGHNYAQSLKDFTAISGPIPMLPRYIFGIFFSRYWAFSSFEQKQIVRDYVQHALPLDTLVTDMDWHITDYKLANEGVRDQAGQAIGWSGWTYDDHLFIDHKGFLDWCKELGLKNTLNVHPASGIQPWEERIKKWRSRMESIPRHRNMFHSMQPASCI